MLNTLASSHSIMEIPNPGNNLIHRAASPLNESSPSGVAPFPERQVSMPKIILIVEPKLFKTCPGNVGQLELGLPGGS